MLYLVTLLTRGKGAQTDDAVPTAPEEPSRQEKRLQRGEMERGQRAGWGRKGWVKFINNFK